MTLKFTFLNVDHGDAIVVEHIDGEGHSYFAVVDSNTTKDSPQPTLDYLKKVGADQLSFVCVTHPHRDHYKGMRAILSQYAGRIESFYSFPIGDFCNRPKNFKAYAKRVLDHFGSIDDAEIASGLGEYLEILKLAYDQFQKNGQWHELAGDGNTLAPVGFRGVRIHSILPPSRVKGPIFDQFAEGRAINVTEGNSDNDRSIALLFEYAGRRVLLGGDGTLQNWRTHARWRRNNNFQIESDVVKIPHHGSREDAADEVLDALFRNTGDERYAVISANGRSHPDMAVVQSLIKRNVRIRCTNLVKEWRSGGISPKGPDTRGVDGLLSEFVRSFEVESAGHGSSCRGYIQIAIHPDGRMTENCEHNVMCPCNPREMSVLLTATSHRD